MTKNRARDENKVTTSDDDDISSPDRISSLGRTGKDGQREKGKKGKRNIEARR
jgi:hypothetical protein